MARGSELQSAVKLEYTYGMELGLGLSVANSAVPLVGWLPNWSFAVCEPSSPRIWIFCEPWPCS